MEGSKKDRRAFLRNMGAMAFLAIGGGAFSACSAPRHVPHRTSGDRLIVDKSAFGEDRMVLIDPPQLEAPVLLRKEEKEEYTAVLLLCTHKACTVDPAGSVLRCPCHGSQFSQHGKVLSGPAEDPLKTYRTEQTENEVRIQWKTS